MTKNTESPETPKEKGDLSKKAKKAFGGFLKFESAKLKVVAALSPLFLLIPGVGPLAAAGIGAAAKGMSKVYAVAADPLSKGETPDLDKLADTTITAVKEEAPGVLLQGDAKMKAVGLALKGGTKKGGIKPG